MMYDIEKFQEFGRYSFGCCIFIDHSPSSPAMIVEVFSRCNSETIIFGSVSCLHCALSTNLCESRLDLFSGLKSPTGSILVLAEVSPVSGV